MMDSSATKQDKVAAMSFLMADRGHSPEQIQQALARELGSNTPDPEGGDPNNPPQEHPVVVAQRQLARDQQQMRLTQLQDLMDRALSTALDTGPYC